MSVLILFKSQEGTLLSYTLTVDTQSNTSNVSTNLFKKIIISVSQLSATGNFNINLKRSFYLSSLFSSTITNYTINLIRKYTLPITQNLYTSAVQTNLLLNKILDINNYSISLNFNSINLLAKYTFSVSKSFSITQNSINYSFNRILIPSFSSLITSYSINLNKGYLLQSNISSTISLNNFSIAKVILFRIETFSANVSTNNINYKISYYLNSLFTNLITTNNINFLRSRIFTLIKFTNSIAINDIKFNIKRIIALSSNVNTQQLNFIKSNYINLISNSYNNTFDLNLLYKRIITIGTSSNFTLSSNLLISRLLNIIFSNTSSFYLNQFKNYPLVIETKSSSIIFNDINKLLKFSLLKTSNNVNNSTITFYRSYNLTVSNVSNLSSTIDFNLVKTSKLSIGLTHFQINIIVFIIPSTNKVIILYDNNYLNTINFEFNISRILSLETISSTSTFEFNQSKIKFLQITFSNEIITNDLSLDYTRILSLYFESSNEINYNINLSKILESIENNIVFTELNFNVYKFYRYEIRFSSEIIFNDINRNIIFRFSSIKYNLKMNDIKFSQIRKFISFNNFISFNINQKITAYNFSVNKFINETLEYVDE